MNSKQEYIPALDGLRAISILLVFFGHIGLGDFIPGGLGVTIFFFISGYIITNLLISEFEALGTHLIEVPFLKIRKSFGSNYLK